MPSKKSNPKPKPSLLHDWSFEAIGTQWWIGVYDPCDVATLAMVRQTVADRIEQFDRTYSRFRADSLVTTISKQAGSHQFPSDADELFALYGELYDATDGAVTPLVGQLLSDAGYDAGYSLQPKQLHTVPAWNDAMNYADGVLTTKRRVLLDFGAAGKGYLVDLISKELQKAGVRSFCIDAGGDMVCRELGAPLRIGLENADDTSEIVGVAELSDGALCGSAGNRRTWAGFTHIMDPKRLESPRHIKAVWVYASNTLTADGLTAALYFVDAGLLKSRFQFEHCMIYADGSVSASPDFPAQLFTNQ